MNETLLSAKQIAALKGVTVRAVHKHAKKQAWPFEEITGQGGMQKHYLLSGVPDEIQLLYNKEQLKSQSTELVPSPGRQVARTIKTAPASLSTKQKSESLLKYDLLRLYKQRIQAAPYGQKTQVRDSFMSAYNSGLLYPELFKAIGKVAWQTIEGWKTDVKNAQNDCFVLADRRGEWRRGVTSIGPEHEKILLACLLHPNNPKIAESIRFAREIMHQRGIENGYSDATYRRWVNDWRERNNHIWTYTREGWKAWNDKCALSGERDYDQIEVGDLVVGDGHTLNFEIINPWTGKPKRMTLILWIDMKSTFPLGWEIMPTENTQAIASAMRWAITRLGKVPKIAYIDNGKAFGARFFEGKNLEEDGFNGLFERLGMNVIHARPYRGQSKTVERFFGTFSELERWSPTFVGTSIATKPPGMNRGEKMHRRIREQMTGGGISIEDAHRAIAEWFDRYVRRPQQDGHLKGIAPIDVFMEGRGPGVDRELLNDLMMAIEVRSIRNSAITMPGGKSGKRKFYHPNLHGRSHKVQVRYDFQDPSYIRVHEMTGELICEAYEYGKLHPAAGHLGTEADRLRLAEHCEEHRRQEKQASVFARNFLQDEFLPAHKKHMEQIGIEPLPVEDKTAPKPRSLKQIPEQTTISEEEWAEIQAEASQAEVWRPEEVAEEADVLQIEGRVEVEEDAFTLRSRLEALPERERYIAIMELEVKGQMVPAEFRDFACYFEYTSDFIKNKEWFDQQKGELAVAWQAERPEASVGSEK